MWKAIMGISAAVMLAAMPLPAQHGHGGGTGMGMHGAPPVFTTPAPVAAAHTANVHTSTAMTNAGTPNSGMASARLTQQVNTNPQFAQRVQPLLPAGMTLQAASAGFRNEGQFLAALHVSRNLGIPFAQLQTKLAGTNRESLGKAIQDLRPNLSRADVSADVRTAKRQARRDLDLEEDANRPVSRLTRAVNTSPRFASRVQPLLPAGMTLQTAAAGFRNQGLFLATLHASRNLGIPFTQLKAKVTGANPESLGQAIMDLRPDLSRATVSADVRTADRQAERDLDIERS